MKHIELFVIGYCLYFTNGIKQSDICYKCEETIIKSGLREKKCHLVDRNLPFP